MESALNLAENVNRIQVSAAAIIREGEGGLELLSARRTGRPVELAGGWEFPGGKWDPGEDGLMALHREIYEEVGVIGLNVLHWLQGDLANGAWSMGDAYALHVYVCTLPAGVEPKLREQHDALAWLPLADAEQVPWLEVDLPPLRALVSWLGGGAE